jgi:hypothetical protein
VPGSEVTSERPRLARIMCQPGAVACVTAVTFSVTTSLVSWPIRNLAFLSVPKIPSLLSQAERSSLTFAICRLNVGIGYAVFASWLILAMGRRWRPEPGWIDRLGRLMGIAWIVWSISYSICPHL